MCRLTTRCRHEPRVDCSLIVGGRGQFRRWRCADLLAMKRAGDADLQLDVVVKTFSLIVGGRGQFRRWRRADLQLAGEVLVFTGMFWFSQVRFGFHRYVLVFTGTFWFSQVCFGFHRYVPEKLNMSMMDPLYQEFNRIFETFKVICASMLYVYSLLRIH